MPPVFNPVSASPTRLWSCAGSIGATDRPSVKAMIVNSSPSRNCSMSTCFPGFAEDRMFHRVDDRAAGLLPREGNERPLCPEPGHRP